MYYLFLAVYVFIFSFCFAVFSFFAGLFKFKFSCLFGFFDLWVIFSLLLVVITVDPTIVALGFLLLGFRGLCSLLIFFVFG